MKSLKYFTLISTLILVFPGWALARGQNQLSVDLPDSVRVGNSELKAGSYKVEWQGAGPAVQVTFLQHGNTVATSPATLKTNDKQVVQTGVVIDRISGSTKALEEIDFAHQKEALVFVPDAK